jgi:VanZ family protein
VSRFLLLWFPVVALMAAIFVTSSMSAPPAPAAVSDKLLHAAAYAALAVVTLRALAGGRWRGVNAQLAVGAWLIATAYGVSDEWHQSFVPGRHADVNDVLADALGAAVGAGVVWAWSIIRRFGAATARRPGQP